jgi:hypothetical protein
VNVAPLISLLTPADEYAAEIFTGKHGMKPFVFLTVGAALLYLSMTGKADKLFKSVFGK